MKVLFPFNQDLNPLVKILISKLRGKNCPVDNGTDYFWEERKFDHDIVHIQWPETLFDWRVPSNIELTFLRSRLREIRKRSKIVYTVHNSDSHHINAANESTLRELYRIVENASDIMVHMGNSSLGLYQGNPAFCSKEHIVIPLPIYDEFYSRYLVLTKEEAKQKLGIPSSRRVILAFGNFRFEKEKQLVLRAFLGLKEKGWLLLAPKWYKPYQYSFICRHPMLTLRSTRKAVRDQMRGMRFAAKKIMSDEDVALHFAAADIVFIQRVDELNSGNLTMGFLFKKIVVGPNSGNIGHWLSKTGNPVFDYKVNGSEVKALARAVELSNTDLGKENYNYAMGNWETKEIAKQHYDLYRSL